MTCRLLLFAAFSLPLILPGAAVSAAPPPPPPNLQVEAGFGGLVRSGRLSPVHVTIDNRGEAIQGTMLIRCQQDVESRIDVLVPRLTSRRYTGYLPAPAAAGRATEISFDVRLLAGRRVLAEQKQAARLLRPEDRLIVSVTGDAAGLQFLDGVENPTAGKAKLRLRSLHVSPGDFPVQWASLSPVDLVAVNGRGWLGLQPEQRRALRQWVEMGGCPSAGPGPPSGRAILCGSRSGEWQDEEARRLTAVSPDRSVLLRAIPALRAWTGKPFRTGTGAPMLAVTGPALGHGSGALLMDEGNLLARARYAAGGVALWTGFDPFSPSFREWPGAPRFWTHCIDLLETARPAAGVPDLSGSSPAIQAARAVPRMPAPPKLPIALFCGAYLVIYGPLNLWLLRQAQSNPRRTLRAWMTMPALALLTAAALLIAGQTWGGARTMVTMVSVLEASPGSSSARLQTLTAVFSPTNRSFEILSDDPSPVLKRPASLEDSTVPAAAASLLTPSTQGEGRAAFERQALVLYAVGGWHSFQTANLGGPIHASAAADGSVTVRNDSGYALSGCILVREGRASRLQDLPRGAVARARAPRFESLPPPGSAPAGEEFTAAQRRMRHELARGLPRTIADQPGSKAIPATWLVAGVEEFTPPLRAAGLPPPRRAAVLVMPASYDNR